MNSNFKLLRTFATVFQVGAWILLMVIGGIGSVAVFTNGGAGQTAVPKWSFVFQLLTGAFWFLVFYTISEVIKLLLAIEAQSRKP